MDIYTVEPLKRQHSGPTNIYIYNQGPIALKLPAWDPQKVLSRGHQLKQCDMKSGT